MRDVATIDGELRIVTRAWLAARHCCDRAPSTALIDQLLDERAALTARAGARQSQSTVEAVAQH